MCLQTRIAQIDPSRQERTQATEVMPMNARPTHILMDKLIQLTTNMHLPIICDSDNTSKRVQGTLHKYIEVNNAVHSFPASRGKLPYRVICTSIQIARVHSCLTVFERSHKVWTCWKIVSPLFSEYSLSYSWPPFPPLMNWTLSRSVISMRSLWKCIIK